MATKFNTEDKVSKTDLFRAYPEDIKVITDRKHPRYDPRIELPYAENKVLSILEFGVLEPIICRKNENDEPEIVNGRQRLKACIEANKRLTAKGADRESLIRIPFVYKNADEKDAKAIATITNTHRTEETVWERIVNFNNNISAFGYTVKHAAMLSNISLPTAYIWEKAINLPIKLQKMIGRGEISVNAALELAEEKDWESKLQEMKEKGIRISASKVRIAKESGIVQRRRVMTYKAIEELIEAHPEFNEDIIKGLRIAQNLIKI